MYCSELRSVLSHSLPSAYLKSYVLKLASFPANPCLAQVLPPPSRPLFRSCLPFAFYLKLPGTCNARILELSAHLCSLNELPRKERGDDTIASPSPRDKEDEGQISHYLPSPEKGPLPDVGRKIRVPYLKSPTSS